MTLKFGFNLYQVKVKFVRPILGAVPYDKEVYARYIFSLAEKNGIELTEEQLEEELDTITDLEEKGWTGFHRDSDGYPLEYDYTWLGFMKEAAYACNKIKGSVTSSVRAWRKTMTSLARVVPRQIPYILPDEVDKDFLEVLERPLRAETPKGSRVALARSDILPPGTTMEFQVKAPEGCQVTKEWIQELFEFGSEFIGYRQWRSGGYGQFELLEPISKA